MLLERKIDDYWNFEGEAKLSVPRKGFARFAILNETPTPVHRSAEERWTKIEAAFRSHETWTEVFLNRQNSDGKIENPRLKAARLDLKKETAMCLHVRTVQYNQQETIHEVTHTSNRCHSKSIFGQDDSGALPGDDDELDRVNQQRDAVEPRSNAIVALSHSARSFDVTACCGGNSMDAVLGERVRVLSADTPPVDEASSPRTTKHCLSMTRALHFIGTGVMMYFEVIFVRELMERQYALHCQSVKSALLLFGIHSLRLVVQESKTVLRLRSSMTCSKCSFLCDTLGSCKHPSGCRDQRNVGRCKRDTPYIFHIPHLVKVLLLNCSQSSDNMLLRVRGNINLRPLCACAVQRCGFEGLASLSQMLPQPTT